MSLERALAGSRRHAVRRWAVPPCALALLVATMAATPGTARAEDTMSAPLAIHAVPAQLLGVDGTTLVAVSDEGGVSLKRSDDDWVSTDLPADVLPDDVTWVGDGSLVVLHGDTVHVLDVGENTAQSYPVRADRIRSATPTVEVDVTGSVDAPQVAAVNLDSRAQTDLAWASSGAVPKGTVLANSEIGKGWISADAWIAPTAYLDSRYRLAGTGLNYVPLDGTAGFARLVAGDVLYAADLGGAVRYVSKEGRKLRDCTVSAATAPTCRTMIAKVSGNVSVHAFDTVLGVTTGSKSYLWQANKLVKVTGIPGHSRAQFTADGTSPVLSVRGAKTGFYAVAGTGRAKLFGAAVEEPAVVHGLDLGAGWLAGTDNLAGLRAWVRPLDDGALGPVTVLSTHANQVATSGARFAVNGRDGLWFYSHGVRTAKLNRVGYLASLSGPYALVASSGGSWSLRTATKVVASHLTGAVGQFGSLVARVDEAAGTVTVADYRSGSAELQGAVRSYDTGLGTVVAGGLWGDAVMLGLEKEESDGTVTATTLVIDYRTGESSHHALAQPTLGDGVVAGWSDAGGAVVWNVTDDSTTTVPHVVGGPVASGTGAVAFTDEYGKLVVSGLDGAAGGASAPRVLASTVSTGTADPFFRAYDGWRSPWRLSVEADKALEAGELTISDGSEVVTTIPVDAAPDGTLSVSWDGTDEHGDMVDGGSYSWRLAVSGPGGPGVDDANLLRTLDGVHSFSGTIDVQNTAMKFPQARPTISDTTPVVGQELTAKPGGTPPGADVAYRWYSGRALVGSDASYVVRAADLGQKLTVRVLVDPSYYTGSTSATSAASRAVGKGTLPAATVVLGGQPPVVGGPVTATLSGGDPDASVTLQWYRVKGTKATAIAQQVGSSYTPTSNDASYRLKLVATVKLTGYHTATASATTSVAVTDAG